MKNPTPLPTEAARQPQRTRSPGLDLTILPRGGLREMYLTLRPLANETPPQMARRLAATLREHEAVVVKQDVFGSLTAHDAMIEQMRRQLGTISWPVTWIEGGACAGGPIAGLQVMAVSGVAVEPLHLGGRVIGRVFNDGVARHCLLGAVSPRDVAAPNAAQTTQVFEALETGLGEAGMNFSHVVRTWLFLDDILSWYGPFNTARAEFFQRGNVLAGRLPASTGISGRNPHGAALLAAAWAVQPLTDSVIADEVPSPLQCPAPQYGSCFSRAVDVVTPGHRRLLISGTASINPDGTTARLGDVRGQIDLTMVVIEAILGVRKMGFDNVTRAIAYFKDGRAAPRFREWCAENHVPSLPVVMLQADVCRDDLLFEMELDAISPARNPIGAEDGWEI